MKNLLAVIIMGSYLLYRSVLTYTRKHPIYGFLLFSVVVATIISWRSCNQALETYTEYRTSLHPDTQSILNLVDMYEFLVKDEDIDKNAVSQFIRSEAFPSEEEKRLNRALKGTEQPLASVQGQALLNRINDAWQEYRIVRKLNAQYTLQGGTTFVLLFFVAFLVTWAVKGSDLRLDAGKRKTTNA